MFFPPTFFDSPHIFCDLCKFVGCLVETSLTKFIVKVGYVYFVDRNSHQSLLYSLVVW